jgi:hypothetical protein
MNRMAIQTRSVKDRRALKFGSLDEMSGELDRVVAAERGGRLRRTGNWTTGQTLNHLATWINFGFDGYPPELPLPPWLMLKVIRMMKKRFLFKPLPAGFSIRGVKGGTLGMEELPLDEAERKVRAAVERLKVGSPVSPNVIFGPLTHEEWKNLHLRHAELHLSFLHPEGAA